MPTYLISVFLATARVSFAARCPPPPLSSMLSSAQTVLRCNNRSCSAPTRSTNPLTDTHLTIHAAHQQGKVLPHAAVVAVVAVVAAAAAAPTTPTRTAHCARTLDLCREAFRVETTLMLLPLLTIAALATSDILLLHAAVGAPLSRKLPPRYLFRFLSAISGKRWRTCTFKC